MAKMRVHELAKELNIKSQDILDKLKNTKFDGKSASSNMAPLQPEALRL